MASQKSTVWVGDQKIKDKICFNILFSYFIQFNLNRNWVMKNKCCFTENCSGIFELRYVITIFYEIHSKLEFVYYYYNPVVSLQGTGVSSLLPLSRYIPIWGQFFKQKFSSLLLLFLDVTRCRFVLFETHSQLYCFCSNLLRHSGKRVVQFHFNLTAVQLASAICVLERSIEFLMRPVSFTPRLLRSIILRQKWGESASFSSLRS